MRSALLNRNDLTSQMFCCEILFGYVQTKFIALTASYHSIWALDESEGPLNNWETLSQNECPKTHNTLKYENSFHQHLLEKGQAKNKCCRSSLLAKQGRLLEINNGLAKIFILLGFWVSIQLGKGPFPVGMRHSKILLMI